jgi:hypothetical protein
MAVKFIHHKGADNKPKPHIDPSTHNGIFPKQADLVLVTGTFSTFALLEAHILCSVDNTLSCSA